ncbi:HEAT repeat domain-containing protein [Halorubrum sp. JWXQ-INN 858]|uniref:HEAT repeat domain-containing protein n=1 Tax=Halorubrum sp. JWXQ-INN 858 TaxID=2690782 RepID=UPI00135CD06D|nr:HEAT repeat domain-containing protein [Halorubrum sp. JWXQ-INN 858]MWV64796.1 HEAT repeat domain-containing protein [Halorubrum sp. JWXQ-INN 858]
MSNGDDDPADAPDPADAADDTEEAADAEGAAAPTLPDEPTEESLTEYLDEIEALLEDADTEADLDDVEALLDDAEAGVAEADLPEPDEDDEDADDPRGDLEDRIAGLRDELEEARGPYAEDVVAAVEAAAETVSDTEWTADGVDDVAAAVESFAGDVADAVDVGVDVAAESEDPASLAAALEAIAEGVGDAGLDPDDDAETIADLIAAADALADALENAEEWDDLETNEQLRAQGFYDVLGHYKDYPVEWSALKEHETRGNVDMILLALDSLGSDFMERHCLEALERMGKRGKTDASVEELLGRAGKRDQFAIRILGKMAAEEATETLVEYVDEDSNPGLQKVTFKALGEIGAAEAVQPLANKLAMDDDQVRPHAARALGLIGDTRAVEPLADALAEDDSDDVRAAAGWALRQIGTRDALEAVAEHADERVYIVQTEAEKAIAALDADVPTA